jgi:proline racemase
MNNMEHRVQYLKDENGHYVGCIAIKEHAASGGEHYAVVEYRLSVRNPADQFDKDVARQLALGRMVEAPYTVRVPSHPNMHEISRALMKDIARDGNAPSRARRAAKLWLRRNGH